MVRIYRRAVPILCSIVLFLVTHTLLPAQQLERVTLQLRWDHQFQFAGYYAALWEGYYADAGIDVDIRSALENGTILNATEEVTAGRAEFGIGSSDILIANDSGAKLVILSSIFQESPAALYSLQSTHMKSPADLIQLSRARIENSPIDIEVRAMLLLEGIDPDKGFTKPHQLGIDHLLNGHVDVIPGYTISMPFGFIEKGFEYNILRPSEYGIKFYGDTLFTGQTLIHRDPGLAERFRDASNRGWLYAMEHPEEIAKKIVQRVPGNSGRKISDVEQFNRFQIDRVKEIMLYPYITIGHISRERWERENELLLRLGIVENPASHNVIVFDPAHQKQQRQAKTVKIIVTAASGVLSLFILITVWFVFLRRTLRKRTNELRDQEKQYRELVDKIPAIIYTFVPGFGGVFFSPYVTILGYTPEELKAQPMLWNESIHLKIPRL